MSTSAWRWRGRLLVAGAGRRLAWIDADCFAGLPEQAQSLLIEGFVRAVGTTPLPTRAAARQRLASTLCAGAEATPAAVNGAIIREKSSASMKRSSHPLRSLAAGQWGIYGRNRMSLRLLPADLLPLVPNALLN